MSVRKFLDSTGLGLLWDKVEEELEQKADATDLPTKVSDLQNDAGYLTQHQDISGKANAADLAAVATSGSYNDLSNKPFIPSAVSDLTDDSGHYTKPVTGIPASDLEETYLTQHQDISMKANSADLAAVATSGSYEDLQNKPTIPTVPTNVSAFTNDAGYLTQHQDISGKANSSDLAAVATSGSYNDLLNKPTIPTDISAFTNDVGYLTEHQDISGKVDKVTGKGLSTNDFTDAYKDKLDSALTSYTETDPTVPNWAKAAQKPAYTASEVGAPTVAEMNTAIGTAIGNVHQFELSIQQSLPTQNIDTHTIYLIPKTGETNDVYDEYVYINNAWEMIGNTQIDLSNYATKSEIPEVPVQDVQVNGTSILSQGVAEIPIMTASIKGVAYAPGTYGIRVSNGALLTNYAVTAMVKDGTSAYRPIVPYNQHESAFYGLAKASGDTTQSESNNAVGTYTTEAKAAIQTMLDVPSNADLALKADKTDTVLETTLSRGRKDNTTAGGASLAFGVNTEASGYYSVALGLNTTASSQGAYAEGKGTVAHYIAHAEGEDSQALSSWSHAQNLGTIANGGASSASGRHTIANGADSFVTGKYNAEDSYDNWPTWTANTSYKVGDRVKRNLMVQNEPTDVGYHCTVANSDAIFDNAHWELDGYHMNYVEIVGNGYEYEDPETHQMVRAGSNAYALTWTGDGKYAGDVYVNCASDSTGGNKLAKVSELPDISVKADKTDTVLNTTLSMGRKTNTTVGNNSVALGYNVEASGSYSHAEGSDTTASGTYSHAEGSNTTASHPQSHAEGGGTQAKASYAHAEGSNTIASGEASHAEGTRSQATNYYAHAEGYLTTASASSAHAEGSYTKATNSYAHAEGNNSEAAGEASHVEGSSTRATASSAHAEGRGGTYTENNQTKYYGAHGVYSHTEGDKTLTTTDAAYGHAEGNYTVVSAAGGHAEGSSTKASNNNSHAEGSSTIASGSASHAEGYLVQATGEDSHAEGCGGSFTENSVTYYCGAHSLSSHSEGYCTIVQSNSTGGHAEGYWTKTAGEGAHAEGKYTVATGPGAHAEGESTKANNSTAHAEGYSTIADGLDSHAEGAGVSYSINYYYYGSYDKTKSYNNRTYSSYSTAIPGSHGAYSHTEGYQNVAVNDANHAEGYNNAAFGSTGSHVEGYYTYATGGRGQHTEGMYTHASGSGGAHAEGQYTYASGGGAEHAEGLYTYTSGGGGCHGEGYGTYSSGSGGNHAEGYYSYATGNYGTHAEGSHTTVSGNEGGHAEGYYVELDSDYGGHAEGYYTKSTNVYGKGIHVEGYYTIGGGEASHTGGKYNIPDYFNDLNEWVSKTSYAVGDKVKRTSGSSIRAYICKTANSDTTFTSSKWTETYQTKYVEVIGNGTDDSHRSNARTLDWDGNEYLAGSLELNGQINNGRAANSTVGSKSIAIGYNVTASGYLSVGIGSSVTASGDNSQAVGQATTASGPNSHAEGTSTTASGAYSHAEGNATNASGPYSHAEGLGSAYTINGVTYTSIAAGTSDHTEGYQCLTASAQPGNHAEGYQTRATGGAAHSEGANTIASGDKAHAEGDSTTASASGSHAEGQHSTASNFTAHAEGYNTTASNTSSHAEGYVTTASGTMSHAEGLNTVASGPISHAEGQYTIAAGQYSHVSGKFNIADNCDNWLEWVSNTSYQVGDKVKITDSNNVVTGYWCKTANSDTTFNSTKWIPLMNYAEIIGNGIDDSTRSNARALDWNGNEYIAGNIYIGCNNDSTGGEKLVNGLEVVRLV